MVTTRYRFYVGLTDRDGLEVERIRYFRAMDVLVEAYTSFVAFGVWKGNSERSLVFEILATSDKDILTEVGVRAVANDLRAAGNQETVMVTIDRSVEVLFF
jgi:hypothetical protein